MASPQNPAELPALSMTLRRCASCVHWQAHTAQMLPDPEAPNGSRRIALCFALPPLPSLQPAPVLDGVTGRPAVDRQGRVQMQMQPGFVRSVSAENDTCGMFIAHPGKA